MPRGMSDPSLLRRGKKIRLPSFSRAVSKRKKKWEGSGGAESKWAPCGPLKTGGEGELGGINPRRFQE